MNTLASSPYMGWSVYVTGTLNVTQRYQQVYVSNQAYGFRVVGATGTRTVAYEGKTTTHAITSVAPPNTFSFEDNIVNVAAPYFDNVVHAITFTLDGPALQMMASTAT